MTQSKIAFSRNCYLGDFYFRYSPHRLPHWPLIDPAVPAQNELNQSKRRTVGPETKRQNSQQNEKKIRRGGSAEFSGKTPTNPRTKRCSGHWIAVVMETWMFTHRFTLLQVCWMVGYYLRHDLQLFERSKFPRICQGFDSTTRAHSGICSDLFSHCLPWPLCFQRYLLHQQPEKTPALKTLCLTSIMDNSSFANHRILLNGTGSSIYFVGTNVRATADFLWTERNVTWISRAVLTRAPQICGKNHKILVLSHSCLL